MLAQGRPTALFSRAHLIMSKSPRIFCLLSNSVIWIGHLNCICKIPSPLPCHNLVMEVTQSLPHSAGWDYTWCVHQGAGVSAAIFEFCLPCSSRTLVKLAFSFNCYCIAKDLMTSHSVWCSLLPWFRQRAGRFTHHCICITVQMSTL